MEIRLLLSPYIGSELCFMMEVVSGMEAVLRCVLAQKVIMQLKETLGGMNYSDLQVLFTWRS